MRTVEPILGAILSKPWAAQEAGSRSVASTSDRFLILKTLPAVGATSAVDQASTHFLSLTGISTVLCKASVQCDAVSFEIFAKQLLTAAAVEALAAKLGIVCNDAIANFEASDVGAHGSDHADSLMAYRELP